MRGYQYLVKIYKIVGLYLVSFDYVIALLHSEFSYKELQFE